MELKIKSDPKLPLKMFEIIIHANLQCLKWDLISFTRVQNKKYAVRPEIR